ncbi:MAG: hypothetical protein AAF770_01650 [Bacteroidota bacterium]
MNQKNGAKTAKKRNASAKCVTKNLRSTVGKTTKLNIRTQNLFRTKNVEKN